MQIFHLIRETLQLVEVWLTGARQRLPEPSFNVPPITPTDWERYSRNYQKHQPHTLVQSLHPTIYHKSPWYWHWSNCFNSWSGKILPTKKSLQLLTSLWPVYFLSQHFWPCRRRMRVATAAGCNCKWPRMAKATPQYCHFVSNHFWLREGRVNSNACILTGLIRFTCLRWPNYSQNIFEIQENIFQRMFYWSGSKVFEIHHGGFPNRFQTFLFFMEQLCCLEVLPSPTARHCGCFEEALGVLWTSPCWQVGKPGVVEALGEDTKWFQMSLYRWNACCVFFEWMSRINQEVLLSKNYHFF